MPNDKLLAKLDAKTVKSEHVKQVEEERKRKEEFDKNVEKATDEVLKSRDGFKKFFSKKRNIVLVIFLALLFLGGLGALAYYIIQKNR